MQRVTLMALVAAWFTIALTAQTDTFAGRWVIDYPLTNAANTELGAPAEHGATITWTVTQDAKTVTVQQGNHPARQYKLDGTDSVNSVMGVNGQTTITSKATLEDGRLRIVTKGPKGDSTAIWTLDKGNLQIVTTSPNPDGSGMTKSALVFKRSL
jgi:hypothetical protein